MRRLFTVAFVRTDSTKVLHLLTIDEVLLGSKFIVNECFGLDSQLVAASIVGVLVMSSGMCEVMKTVTLGKIPIGNPDPT